YRDRCPGTSAWPHRRCWPSRSDLGERWPSRLVATAAEDGLKLPAAQSAHVICGSQRLPNNRDLRVRDLIHPPAEGLQTSLFLSKTGLATAGIEKFAIEAKPTRRCGSNFAGLRKFCMAPRSRKQWH